MIIQYIEVYICINKIIITIVSVLSLFSIELSNGVISVLAKKIKPHVSIAP